MNLANPSLGQPVKLSFIFGTNLFVEHKSLLTSPAKTSLDLGVLYIGTIHFNAKKSLFRTVQKEFVSIILSSVEHWALGPNLTLYSY